MHRRRWTEALFLAAAAVLFGRVLTLPLSVLARENPPALDPEVDPWAGPRPPAWLLPFDDAYIFIRYAEQAARGKPLQWNDGEPSTGASSFLFPWLLLPTQWTDGSLVAASRWSRTVGIASLWLLGLAAARVLRAAKLPDPWPLAGGLAVVWSGPIGFGAVAGMESAGNAALILWTVGLWMEALWPEASAPEEPWPPPPWIPLVAAGLLPLARPENVVLALAAVLAVALGLGPWKRPRWRWLAVLPLLPGLALALLNLALTGEAQPAGALAKSWLATPFLPLTTLLRQLPYELADHLLPVYLGTAPLARPVLWPPVGLLAAATALCALGAALVRSRQGTTPIPGDFSVAAPPPTSRRDRLATLAPLGMTWTLLFLLAPLSGLLLWQQMRHHHAGLACAWVLAIAGLAIVLGPHLGPRRRRAVIFLPLPLLLAFPHWAREHTRAATGLYDHHREALAWLAAGHARGRVLLLNDAGLLALVHDGPAIDLMGLGTPAFARAYRHGPGAIAEALARRRPLPEVAAIVPELFDLPELLGDPLLPPPATSEGTLVAPVRRELLAGTPLEGPGVDFADLPSERRARVRWILPPGTQQPSFALPFAAPGGRPAIQGCRPLFGKVGAAVPPGTARIRLRVAGLPTKPGSVVLRAGRPGGPEGQPLGKAALTPGSWAQIEAWPGGAPYLWIERQGAGIPCVESALFLSSR